MVPGPDQTIVALAGFTPVTVAVKVAIGDEQVTVPPFAATLRLEKLPNR